MWPSQGPPTLETNPGRVSSSLLLAHPAVESHVRGRLAEGAFFGESSLQQHNTVETPLRQANVVAVSAVRLARLPVAHFGGFCTFPRITTRR